jgi:hypothetical protein
MSKTITMNKLECELYLHMNSKVLVTPDGKILTPEDLRVSDLQSVTIVIEEEIV